MGLDYVHSRGARSHLLVERKSGIPLDELNDDYFLPDHFLHDYFLPSKNRETLPSVEKKQQHTSQESLETTGKSNNHKGASVLLLQFPPPGSVGPTGSPRAGSPGSGSHSICDLHRHPPPLPNLPDLLPPLQGPPVPSPPSSKVVVLGLPVGSRFFYPVIINLVYPILFSPLSRVATIRLELPSRGVGGP